MPRFKLLHNRKPLSSQEIAKKMNFNNFISSYTPSSSVLHSIKSWFILGAGSITAIVVAVMLLRSPSKHITESFQPFVAPPLPQLNIPTSNLLVSGTRDTVINYPTGTKLFIPAGAFVYSDSKQAVGPFRIYFREFHDQIDQLLSGIPMMYDSAGVKKQFESAGMFDVRAYENDLPVFIKERKELIVDMQSQNLDNDFNVYYLDTVQKKWIYDKENSENNILLTAGVDTLLHQKFQSGFETMVLPVKADPLFDNLVIDFDKEEFPELALFDNVKFQFTDKKNKGYAGGFNKTWDDVKITKQSNKQYLVTFSKGKFKTSLVTTPVLEGKDFESALAEYDKIRVLRISKFKSVSDSIRNLVKSYDAQLIQNSLSSNQRINDLIHNGNFQDAMNNYIDDETLNLMSKQKNGLSRMIFVRKFGISNFDRPFPLANAFSKAVRNTDSEKKHVLPKAHYYHEKDNIELEVENAYLIKRKFNGTYTLSKKSISEFPVLEAKGSDILIVITTKKEILFIKDKEFNAIDYSGSEIAFRMHAISQQVKSSEEIKKYLNL